MYLDILKFLKNSMSLGDKLIDFARESPFIAFLIVTAVAGGAYATIETIYTHPRQPKVLEENVIEGPADETFVTVNGDRYYKKIDGIPLERRDRPYSG